MFPTQKGPWPKLLATAAPNPISLPASDRNPRAEGESPENAEDGTDVADECDDRKGSEEEELTQEEGETEEVFEDEEAVEQPPSAVDAAEESLRKMAEASPVRGAGSMVSVDEVDHSEAGSTRLKSFSRLLLEVAAEHRRELEGLRARLKEAEAAGFVSLPPLRCAPDRSSGGSQKGSLRNNSMKVHIADSVSQYSSLGLADFETGDLAPAKPAVEPARRFSHFDWTDPPMPSSKSTRLSPFDFCDDDDTGKKNKSSMSRSGSNVNSGEDIVKEKRLNLLNLLGWDTTTSCHEVREGVVETLLQKIIRSASFDSVSGIMIILNTLLQGWASNHAVTAAIEGLPPDEVPRPFQIFTVIFTVWFSLELVARLYASGIRNCFSRRDDEWQWNLFDAIVVSSDVFHSILELVNVSFGGSVPKENITVVRILRVFRITRTLRVVRLIRFFRELRMMVFSVLRSASSLLWSLVLLTFTIYAFAVYFCQIASYHFYLSSPEIGSPQASKLSTLEEMFGNLIRAEYVLYMAVSGGISWGEINSLFIDIHPIHGLVFCIFVFFTTFAVLNIITGIFVETAMSSARNNQEELVQEQMHATVALLEDMKRIFSGADANHDGTICLEEFEEYLDRKEVRAYLDALGIGLEKAKGLFELLDLDQSGEITLEEFTFGCLRLKGSAKSIDLATLMNHNRRMAEQWKRYFAWTERQFARLHRFEEHVEARLAALPF